MTMIHKLASCIVLLYVLHTYAKHAHRLLNFKTNTNEQDITWRKIFATTIECVAACFQDESCICVHFSSNRSCLGFKVKLEKTDAAVDRAKTEHVYVMDTEVHSCGPPPKYQNAVVNSSSAEYTAGEKAVYSCKPGFTSCFTTMTRTCLQTGKWETDKITCAKNHWTHAFGRYQRKFGKHYPCGAQSSVNITIHGAFTDKKMQFLMMRKAEALFYIRYDGNEAVYGDKFNKKWRDRLKRYWGLQSRSQFLLEIFLDHGIYKVFLDHQPQGDLKEKEAGGKTSFLLILDDVNLKSVTIHQ